MKVKLLPLAVTAAIALPGLALADGPTVYGKLNVSLDRVKFDYGYDPMEENNSAKDASSQTWQLNSNASRFGVKGDAAINSKLKATYLLEWEVDTTGDKADGANFTNRNRSVGLAGDFGALDVGQFDTPTKVSQGKIDQFNDLAGDLKFVLPGDVRAANILQYTSPAMSGVQAKLAVMPGEQFDDGTGSTKNVKDGVADAASASVAYTQGAIYAALGYDHDVNSSIYTNVGTDTIEVGSGGKTEADFKPYQLTKASAYLDTVRLAGQYTAGAVSVGAIYEQSKVHNDTPSTKYDLDGFLLSGAYTMGQTVLKAQYIQSTGDDGEDKLKSKSWSLGVDQKLSAQTLVGGYYTALSFEGDWDGAETQSNDTLGAYISHTF